MPSLQSICLSILLSLSISAFSQQELNLTPQVNGKVLKLNKKYKLEPEKHSFKIETLKFYLSNITFFQDEEEIYTLEKKHFLVDLLKPESLVIPISSEDEIRFNKISFDFGVDSISNVGGALGGDLEPSNGMYWAWQSGYINLKLEGTSSICPARDNTFQFHLGGYQFPFKSVQRVELTLNSNNKLTVNMDIGTFIKQVNLAENYQIMSPSENAVQFSKIMAEVFKIAE